MNKDLFVLIVIALFLIGCNRFPNNFSIGVGRSDFENCNDVHLCNGDTISWAQTGDSCCYFESEGKFFNYHQKDTVRKKFVISDSGIYGTIIRGHVVDYSRNGKYLLVDQKPIDSILGKEITIYSKDGRYSYSRREYDTVNQYDAYWRMLDNSPVIHQYWIIVIKTADVYGPYSYKDYLNMRQQLGVPPTLILKCDKNNIDK